MSARGPGPVFVVVATCFGFALVQLDVTVVNVALPRIGAELGTDVSGLQWVVDAYALVFASLLLTAGHIGDRYGARRVYLAGLALFAAASLGCGLAGSAGALILGRAAQGIGAAAMLPSSLAVLNAATGHDKALRAWAVGWWTAASSVTVAAGPIVGGLILGVASWRAIFLVNLPLCAVGVFVAARMPAARPRAPDGRGFDPAGQFLAVVALAALIGAVIEAKPLGLASPAVLAGFALGIAAAIGFALVEARGESPMLPLSLFRLPNVAVCVGYGMAANFTYYGVVFVLSLYLQRALGYGATQTGFAYIPLTATFILVNLVSGPLVARFGPRLPMVGGALVDAAGFALLLGLGGGSPYAAMLLPFALIPAGMGTGVPAMTTAVLASVPPERAGIAAAVLNAGRQAAGAMGVAVFGTLASGGREGIVAGLHASAAIAVGVLLVAAALAAFGIARRSRAIGS